MLALTAVSFAISGVYYDQLPAQMASHWDGADRVNGHMSRFWGAFTMPLILLALTFLLTFIFFRGSGLPGLENKGGRITGFLITLFVFFDLLHFQVIQWNLGNEVSFMVTVPIGIGAIFIAIGMMLSSVERNWVVGIRTYWTLKNPVVWEQTHKRAALLFKILGCLYIVAAFFREYVLLFMLLPAVFLALYLPAYSFLLYQKIGGNHTGEDT